MDAVSFPYSYSCDAMPADAENLYEAALGAAFAARKTHGTIYTVRTQHFFESDYRLSYCCARLDW